MNEGRFDEMAKGLATNRFSRVQVLKSLAGAVMLAGPLGSLWNKEASAQTATPCTQASVDSCVQSAQRAFESCKRRCGRLSGSREKKCLRRCRGTLTTKKTGCQCLVCPEEWTSYDALTDDRDAGTLRTLHVVCTNPDDITRICSATPKRLCANANQNASFVKLMHYLISNGFSRDGQPEYWQMDTTTIPYRIRDALVTRFVKADTGQTALLRYAEEDSSLEPSSFALIEKGDVPQHVLFVGDEGTIEKLPIDDTTATSGAAHDGAEDVEAGSGADTSVATTDLGEPTLASYTCQYCGLICGLVLGAPCSVVGLLLTKKPKVAKTFGKACKAAAGLIAGLTCDDICKIAIDEETKYDALNCGGCGKDGSQYVCAAGFETCCNGNCVNLQTDERYCGTCFGSCGTSETCCDGFCWDISTSRQHCGSCGNACETGQLCKQGVCVDKNCGRDGVTCPPDKPTCCDGTCVNLNSGVFIDGTLRHCGQCGTSCPDWAWSCGLPVPQGFTCPSPVNGKCQPGMCCVWGVGVRCEPPS